MAQAAKGPPVDSHHARAAASTTATACAASNATARNVPWAAKGCANRRSTPDAGATETAPEGSQHAPAPASAVAAYAAWSAISQAPAAPS